MIHRVVLPKYSMWYKVSLYFSGSTQKVLVEVYGIATEKVLLGTSEKYRESLCTQLLIYSSILFMVTVLYSKIVWSMILKSMNLVAGSTEAPRNTE